MPRPQDRPPDSLGMWVGDGLGANLVEFVDNTFVLGEIEVDLDFLEGNARLDQVRSKREWESFISTMYKRKDRKIRPVNRPLPHGPPPGGNVNGEPLFSDNSSANGKFKPTIVPRGSRLTPERLSKMKIGTGFLTEVEKQLFIDILFEFEGVIAFEDSEMELLNPAIEPPIHIHTVPHIP